MKREPTFFPRYVPACGFLSCRLCFYTQKCIGSGWSPITIWLSSKSSIKAHVFSDRKSVGLILILLALIHRLSVSLLERERERVMEEDQIEKLVAAYLKKKGFKQAEHAFQEELQQQQQQPSKNNSSSSISTNSFTDSDIAKHLLAFSGYSLSLSLSQTVGVNYLHLYSYYE